MFKQGQETLTDHAGSADDADLELFLIHGYTSGEKFANHCKNDIAL